MGGPGSGNRDHWWRRGKKGVVEDCLSLDSNRWMREGGLKAGVRQSGSWDWTYPRAGFQVNYEVNTLDPGWPCVRLWYSWAWSSTGQEDSADYYVGLTTTQPQFGGLRWWF